MKGLMLAMLSFILSLGQAYALNPGDNAPDFSLMDQHQAIQTLSDYRGQWVVVYFYPKNDTPGCTTEACSFRDNINGIIAKQATVFGVSVDSVESHKNFAKTHRLPFSLLSDSDGKVAASYNSLFNLGIMKFARRNSFIIDPNGQIAKVYKGVDPQTHVAEVLRDLQVLQEANKTVF
ncbi:peroxiredoxin [Thiomicrospira sp. R3]|uniref:peroxiredoxin n=1 Tax=Thiomicrospira sp. R3 TaxID=3035472 RepID=UPI00259BEE55|nr:peroxiredoxin [Thiomicrospira sp. R3]WFE69238.1 peroxiredoxin [Thiomicrospira sp. R3]